MNPAKKGERTLRARGRFEMAKITHVGSMKAMARRSATK